MDNSPYLDRPFRFKSLAEFSAHANAWRRLFEAEHDRALYYLGTQAAAAVRARWAR